MPQRAVPFELLGEVVWATTEGDEAGMGIKFVYTTDTQRSDFEGVVETLMKDSVGADVTVLEAGPKLKVIAENNMGSSVYSTAVPANGTLFIVNRNQLVAIAEKP